MARRRRRYGRRKTPNVWFVIFQIVVLAGLLYALIEVRDSIGQGTSVIVESLATEDIDVRDRSERQQSEFPGSRTDDEAQAAGGHEPGDQAEPETEEEIDGKSESDDEGKADNEGEADDQ